MKHYQTFFLIISTLFFFINSKAQTPQLLLDINPGSADGLNPFNKSFARLGETVFFSANDGVHGVELYKEINGSVSLVKDINPGATGSIPFILGVYKNRVYFNANDGISGPELWVSDGTDEGTTLFYESVTGSQGEGFIKAIAGKNGLLYFATPSKLFMTSSLPEDVRQITSPHEMQLTDVGNGSHERMIAFENGIAFPARSNDSSFVYKTIGITSTAAIVTKVAKSSSFAGIDAMESVNGRIVFVLDNFSEYILYSTAAAVGSIASKYTSPAGSTNLSAYRFIPYKDDVVLMLTPNRLYAINGFSTQTVNLGPFNTSFTQGVAIPSGVLDGKAYFSMSSFGDVYIYETDGTLAGTKMYYDSPEFTFGEMVSYGGSIFFTTGINNNFVPKIYQFESDDLNPQIIHSYTANSTNGPSVQILGFNGNQMYFSSNLGAVGREMYKLQVDVNTASKEITLHDAPYLLLPAGDRTFKIDKAEMNDLLDLKLMDLQGKLIWSEKVYGNNSFQLPDLQGIYILHVAGSEGERSFKVPVWR
jgi:ELWxxDGT repeat protein